MDSLISGDITAITSICVIYRSSSVKRDLAFTPEGIGRYKTVVMVYGYAGYPLINLNDLEENVLYLFKAELSKSEISDMIEGNIISYISKGILKAYFYDARDQYGGFKFLAMKAL